MCAEIARPLIGLKTQRTDVARVGALPYETAFDGRVIRW